MYHYRYIRECDDRHLPNAPVRTGDCDCRKAFDHGMSETQVKLMLEVLAYHDIPSWNMGLMTTSFFVNARRWSNNYLQGEFEKRVVSNRRYPTSKPPRFHKPNARIDASIAMMAANFADLEARIDPSMDHIFKNHPSLMTHISTPTAKSPELYAKMYGAGPATLDKIKENTMSNNTQRPGSFDQAPTTFDPETGARIPGEQTYRSRILNGSELEVGKQYKLEIVGGKNPPEIAKAGFVFTALGNSVGEFEGDMLTDGYSVFQTDESDLWLQA